MANKQKLSWFLKAMLFLGLAFLYIPLIVLVVYSFNDSKLVTIWGGFSTKWYAKLLNNDQIFSSPQRRIFSRETKCPINLVQQTLVFRNNMKH